MEVFELKIAYEKAVNNYVEVFCKKYDLHFDYWVAEDVGTIAALSDYFLNFHNIKYCIDNNLDWEIIVSWYDYCIDNQEIKFNLDNYNRLYIDFKFKKGFGFNINDFHRYLETL